jgi:hypothetical protein
MWNTTMGWLDSDGYMESVLIRLPLSKVRATTTKIFTGDIGHLLRV